MAWKYWMIAATGACAFTMTVGGAQSAPLGSAATDFRSSAAAGTSFQLLHYQPLTATALVGHTATGRTITLGLVRTATGRACPGTRRLAYTGLRSGTSRLPYSPTVLLRVSGDVAPPAYVDSIAPVLAPPGAAAPAPVYGYAAAPPAVYGAGPPIVRRLIPAIEYAHPDAYPVVLTCLVNLS